MRASIVAWLGLPVLLTAAQCDAAVAEAQSETAPNPFSAYLSRSYYTSEQTATVLCQIGLSADGLKGMTLRAGTGDGQALAAAGELTPDTALKIPLADLPVGEHRIALELRRADGSAAARQQVTLLKRAPRPGCEWKIDRVNRGLLRDGEPFFPFGFIMGGVSPEDDWAFRDVAALGANCVVHWRASHCSSILDVAADARAYVDAAGKHGLAVVFVPDENSSPVTVDDPDGLLSPEQRERLSELTATPRGRNLTRLRTSLVRDPLLKTLPVAAKGQVFFRIYEQQLPLFRAIANAVRSAPNLVGYQPLDEPNLPSLNQDVAGRDYYRQLHAADGYHPVFVLYNTLWDTPAYRTRITDWCDVLVQDPYWIPAGGRDRPTQSVVTHVAEMVARTKRLADSARRVTMTAPLAEVWSGCRKRIVSPAEQRCQTYLALIHGSKGILYFRYPLMHQGMADTMAQLAREIELLGPICLTPEVEQETRYTPGTLDPIARKHTDVQVSLRRHPRSGYLLLCANTAHCPVDATFTVSLLGLKGEVSRLFGDETYTVANRAFTDRLEGFGTRAYLIESQATDAQSAIRIHVAMKPHPELATAEPTADAELNRAGRKNKLPNSSFEQATVPGWPDYYRYAGATISPEERIGSPKSAWGVDTGQPYHGDHCLRMNGGVDNRQTYIEYNIDPALTPQARPFVLSAWMRASRDGMKVGMYVTRGTPSCRTMSLTTRWARYRLPVTLPARTSYLVMRWHQNQNEEGDTVWIDAAQLEMGHEPTEYEP